VEELAKTLKVSPVRVVQEAYEMAILRGLAESKIGRFLVFKGGTALRLIYGAPRFSEDLDFSLTKSFPKKDFKSVVQEIAKEEPYLELVEALKKRWTFFALFRVREEFLAQPCSIKVEISSREKIKKFETRVATSEAVAFEVLLKVFSLEQLFEDKKRLLKKRAEPKDLFDLWYLSQKLKREVDIPTLKISKKHLKRELHKFLPQSYWPVVEELSQYAKG